MAKRLTMAQVAKAIESLRIDVKGLNVKFGGLSNEVGELRGEVGGLRGEVGGLRGEVKGLHGEVGNLCGEVGGLRNEVADLRGEVKGIHGEFNEFKQDVHRFEDNMIGKFSNLQSSVDTYLKRTEAWHDEQVILKSRHNRLSDVLVGKGIVTKEEILL